ncbi:MAG: HYR domain-containing protein, partial [Gorillibacterium sp.]|nr:HYR domain-containing protein [Gorillibacterium sp.]
VQASVYGTGAGTDPVNGDMNTVFDAVYGIDDTLGVILHTKATELNLLASSAVNGTLSAASPLLQQMRLSEPSAVIPGGRGFMLPQVVAVKDPAGNPLAGIPVTFEASLDSTITAVMRGLNSSFVTVVTDANGVASAANTFANYLGEGFQVYSKNNGIIKTLEVKASVSGLQPVTFRVEVGTVGANLLDTTPPTITSSAKNDGGTSYIAGTWTNRSVTVHYTAMDTLSAIKFCTADQVFANEGANQIANGKAIDSAATSDEDKNHYSLTSFGPIHIDKTAPVTNATVSNVESGIWNHDTVTIHFASEDPLSGVESIYYKLGDHEPVKVDASTALAEISSEGTTTISYWAADKSGNIETAKSISVKIDKSGPEISSNLSPKANEKGWNSSNVTVSLAASDANSGVKELHYKIGEAGEAQIVQGGTATFTVQTEGITPITFWAVDYAGNTAPVQSTQVKIDKTIPVLTVPADKSLEATAVRSLVDIGKATVQDVSLPDVIVTNDAPADFPIGTTTVKWTAIDPVGNISSQVQKITVKDTTKPVLTVQGDVVLEATAIKTPAVLNGAAASDIFPVIVVNDAPKEFPVGTTKVTWTATDANSNIITATQNVIIADTTKPVLTAPAKITLEATARRTPVAIGTATAQDIFKVTVTHNAPADFPVEATTVTWKAEDENGNAALADQLITITDTTKPVLVIPQDITVEATDKRMKLNIGQAKATDIFDVLLSNDAPVDYPVGTTKITWTAKDENGNITTAEQKITVTDTTVPLLTVPKDITAEATGLKTTVDLGQAVATDIFQVTVTNNVPDGFAIGKTAVTWTATDENGNVSKGTQSITIVDTTKPLLTLPGDKTVEATGERTKVDIGQPIVTDLFSVTVTNDAPADYPLGLTVVTWSVTDANGNKITGTQKVSVVDKTKPVLTVPKDVNVEATAVKSKVDIGQPTVTDLFKFTVINDAPADYPVGTTKVTWMATDASGNVAIGSQNVTVVDTTNPVLHAPADVRVEATAVKTPVTIGQATATDIFPVIIKSDAPADYPVGTTVVTWTATDANGKISTGTQNVVVVDTIIPVLTVPEDISIEATAVKTPVAIGLAKATDLFEVKITNNAPSDYPLGKTIVTWKATDANGNVSTGSQTITVVDTTAPAITAPTDLTIEATGEGTPVQLVPPAVADIFQVTAIGNDAPANFPIGLTQVTWKATDANGNSSTYKQKVTLVDTTKPILTVPKDVQIEATAIETPVQIGVATATDLFVVTITNDAPENYPLGTTQVIWKVTDANGNAATGIQKITIVDTTAPELKQPADITLEATALRTPVVIGQATATDIFKVTLINDAPADYPIGTTQVIWKATDEKGNISTEVQKITIVDTTVPELKLPVDITLEATAVRTPIDIGQATATDIFKVTLTNDAPIDYPIGATQVKWTIKDDNNNETTGVQNITVVDTTKPGLTVPEDKTLEATAVRTPVNIGQAIATDIFKVTITSDAPLDYPIGSTKVKWTATDENGNVSTGVQNITIVDTTKPELKLPTDITLEATAVRTPVSIGQATAVDLFPVAITNNAQADYPLGTTQVTWTVKDANGNEFSARQNITIVDTTTPLMKFRNSLDLTIEATAAITPVELEVPEGIDIFPVIIVSDAPGFNAQDPIVSQGKITAGFPLGTTKVTWTARDTSGNTTLGIVTVTIKDTTKPVLKVPADILLEAAAIRTPVDIGKATAMDIFNVTVASDAPADYLIGTTQVTWTATDANGNMSSGTQKITIVDTIKPVLTVPADKTVEASALKTPVEIGQATATDIYKVTVTSDAPTDYLLGTTQVKWSAMDENGNVSTGIQKITIVDKTKPELTVPADKTVEASAVKTPVDIGHATATDIYGVTVTSDAPADYLLGTTEVTWTATDANGNVSTGVQKITIVDKTKPELTVPGDKTVEASAVKTPVDIGQATATDIYKVTIVSDGPADYLLGTTKVNWTATDENGNVTTGIQKITIVDTSKPVLTVPEDKTVEASALKTPVEIGQATATDIYKVTIVSDGPADYLLGTTLVNWTATDENGNVTTVIQKITIVDTTKPVLTVPEDKTVEASALKTPVDIGHATATDIYGVTVVSDAPADYLLGTTEVTWTATDENGNVSTVIQKITVVDKTKPVLIVPADKTVEASAVKTLVSIGQATATDIYKVAITSSAPADYLLGITQVTWTATDANGNVSTGVQKITIVDTTAPLLKAPADLSVAATGTKTLVTLGQATVTDIFGYTVKNDAPVEGFLVGKTAVTWTATDVNGNISKAVQYVTVLQEVKVKSYNATRSNSTNTITPRITFENIGSNVINLSDIKIRYYYTVDGEKAQTFFADYSTAGSRTITSNVTGSFKKSTSKPGSDYYLEIGFSSNAGSLKPGEKVQIQCRFWKSDWSNYTQTNDYSFNLNATDYTDTSKITAYSSGTIIAGIEP